jgi:hypothetical protein
VEQMMPDDKQSTPKKVKRAVFRKEQGVTHEYRDLIDHSKLVEVSPDEFWSSLDEQLAQPEN